MNSPSSSRSERFLEINMVFKPADVANAQQFFLENPARQCKGNGNTLMGALHHPKTKHARTYYRNKHQAAIDINRSLNLILTFPGEPLFALRYH